MTYGYLDIARTAGVVAAQAEMGADGIWADWKGDRTSDRFTAREQAFIAERDSFYIATVSETGWPYVQHRGGPSGFLRLIDERTLAFLDYRGNRQYVSTGNLRANDRASLILVDYVRRARLKIFCRIEKLALDDDENLLRLLSDPDYRGVPERIFRLHLEAFDWNCPQHIARRFSETQVSDAVQPLHDRIARLEEEIARLRRNAGNPPSN